MIREVFGNRQICRETKTMIRNRQESSVEVGATVSDELGGTIKNDEYCVEI